MAYEDFRVRLNGLELVWMKDGHGITGPLAPLEHIEPDGSLNIGHGLLSDSYAHVCDDGLIRRYRCVIGSVDDLELINPPPTP